MFLVNMILAPHVAPHVAPHIVNLVDALLRKKDVFLQSREMAAMMPNQADTEEASRGTESTGIR
jgi:hypothetical protein